MISHCIFFSLTKPQSFADCVGDELPVGWEETYDPSIGVYYINHIQQTNQVEDPRLQWRQQQEVMLKEYLVTAQDDLEVSCLFFDHIRLELCDLIYMKQLDI
ncbi:hypothetical protein LOTGIDRAFT_123009 [Lottia gigantea]|uniref:WW domain-containing protein n=1 Tax=Lottia gigantea TaxID=225164 RepID=V4BNX0_LOTGI|nr:hypothetical protein LOTGIDRAFT_123009 [Lottia gigantea]ESO90609.1 hypothetical protein LOTGIDRAFT_123009 [Lottia gigantea]